MTRENPNRMKLLLLSHDLMIGSRVEGAARQYELTIVTVGDQQATVAAVGNNDCQLLLVDLRTPEVDIEDLVEAVRKCCEQHLPIIACAPHVHEAKLTAARQAGCDAVITRGQLDRELETILGRLIV